MGRAFISTMPNSCPIFGTMHTLSPGPSGAAKGNPANVRERAVGGYILKLVSGVKQATLHPQSAGEVDCLLIDAVILHFPLRERVFNRIREQSKTGVLALPVESRAS